MGNEIQWIPILLGFASGGAMGAIITALVTTFRNRIQPVGCRFDSLPMFQGAPQTTPIQARVTLSDGSGDYNFDNLHVLEVEIVNRGNQDRKSFKFGITLSPGQQAVFVDPKTSDRHHQILEKSDVSPTKPVTELDYVVEPFNRGDRYSFTIYVVLPPNVERLGDVYFSSPEPVTFSPMPTVGEIVGQLASSTSLAVGPFRVTIGLK